MVVDSGRLVVYMHRINLCLLPLVFLGLAPLHILQVSVGSCALLSVGDGAERRGDWGLFGTGARRFLFFMGSRREALRLGPVIVKLRESSVDVFVVSTAENVRDVDDILSRFAVSCDVHLGSVKGSGSLGMLRARTSERLGAILDHWKPGVTVVQGGTATAYFAALESFYRHIPVAHVDAGVRTSESRTPFSYEYNQQAIDLVTEWHFAATEREARNLLSEGKSCESIYLVGSTVVEALRAVSFGTEPSGRLKLLMARLRKVTGSGKFLILLILKRLGERERQMGQVFAAVFEILRNFEHVGVFFPIGKNANVRRVLLEVLPLDTVLLVEQRATFSGEWDFLNRFLLVDPLNLSDGVHSMRFCDLVLTDSRDIQEETECADRQVLVVNERTGSPELVRFGSALLVEATAKSIVGALSGLLTNKSLREMKQSGFVYGFGNASTAIVDVLLSRAPVDSACRKSFSDADVHKMVTQGHRVYEVVIVLTVWKRMMLDRQLRCVASQASLRGRKVLVIVFQNGCHVDISDVLLRWKSFWSGNRNVDIRHVHSTLESGYYGRFLAPLMADSDGETVWILHDDDILFGSRYYENIFRVVEAGFLATRNCRMIGERGEEVLPAMKTDWFVTWESDMVCDFGGHIWAGRMAWLRDAWSHPPLDVSNCEDFWLSAVLKVFQGVGTRSPRCPKPNSESANWHGELCACADLSALRHQAATVGETKTRDRLRNDLMMRIVKRYNFSRILDESPRDFARLRAADGQGYVYHPRKHSGLFHLNEEFEKNCYSWN